MAEKTKIAKPLSKASSAIAQVQRKKNASGQRAEEGKTPLSFLGGFGGGQAAVQAKLSIGAPNDKYEVEADQMASEVMRMPEPASCRTGKSELPVTGEGSMAAVRCKCSDCKREEEDTPRVQKKDLAHSVSLRNRINTVQRVIKPNTNSVDHIENEQNELKIQRYSYADRGRGPPQGDFSSKLNQSKGSGQAMDSHTNSFMSSRFGADFSNVKVHTGNNAAQMSNDINAKAFTHQNHIYFNQGQYQPNTAAGKTLLAHELTHTIQQGAVNGNVQRKCAKCEEDKVQRKLTIGSPNDRLEQEADVMADRVMRKEKANQNQLELKGAIQRATKKAPVELEKPTETLDLKGGLIVSEAMINWLWTQPKRIGNVAAKFGSLAKGNLDVKVASKRRKTVSTVDNSQGLEVNVAALNPLKNYGIVPAIAVTLKENALSGYLGVFADGKQLFRPDRIFSWIQENTSKFGLDGVELMAGISANSIVSTLNENGFSLDVNQVPIRLGGFLNGTFDFAVDNGAVTFSIDADVDLPLLDPTSLHLERDASGKLSGHASTGFNIQKLNGTVKIEYNAGVVDIYGEIAYKDEQFDGKISIVLTDYETAMNLAFSQLEPTEIASLSKVVTESNKAGERALVGFGEVQFTLNEYFQGRVKVIVDGEGHVTVIGKLTQENEIPLFKPIKPKEKYNKLLLDYRIRYGIPLLASIGIGVNIGVFADWGINPGVLHNLFIEGVYSTNPKLKNNRYSIGGNINISAFAEAGLYINVFGFGELLGHEIKVGLNLRASARVEGYLDAGVVLGKRNAENNPEKSEYFIHGTVLMAAQPSVGLSSSFFVDLDSPWWSPVPDANWEWPLSDHYFPVAEDLGLAMDIDHVIGADSLPEISFKPHSFDPAFFMDAITEDPDSLKGDSGDKEMTSEFKDKTNNGNGEGKPKRGKKNKKIKGDNAPSKEELAAFEAVVKKADSMDTTVGSMSVESAREKMERLKRMAFVREIKLFKKEGTKHFVYIETEKTNNRLMQRPVYWDVDENRVFGADNELSKQDLVIRKRKVEELESLYLNENRGLANGILFEQQVKYIQGSYISLFGSDIFNYNKSGQNWVFEFGGRHFDLARPMQRKLDSQRSMSLISKSKIPNWADFVTKGSGMRKSFVDAGEHKHEVYFKMNGRNIDVQMASSNPGDIENKIKEELNGPSAGTPAEKANLKVAIKQIDTFENKMESLLLKDIPENSEQTQAVINVGSSALDVAINLLKAGKYGDDPKPENIEEPAIPNPPGAEPEETKPVDPKLPKTDPPKAIDSKPVDPKPHETDLPKTQIPEKVEKVDKIIENPVSAATAHKLAGISNRLNSTSYSTGSVNLPGGFTERVGLGMSTPYLTNHPSKIAEGSDKTGAVQKSIYGFGKLPTRGAFGNSGGYRQNMVYIKGHLLNGNVGGPAQNSNLFPITGQANSDHKNGPEKWVKSKVLNSKLLVYYGVNVRGRTNVAPLDVFGDGTCLYYYLNANYVCRYSTYKLFESGKLEANPLQSDSISSQFNVDGFKALVSKKGCPQRKPLKINVPADSAEREADQTADRVMRKPISNSVLVQANKNKIQRKSWDKEEQYNPYLKVQRKANSNGAGGVDSSFERGLSTAKGAGQPMDKSTQTFMENRFGADFSGVKVHNDSQAANLSDQIQAKAFTVGNDIYFNQGQYNPESNQGKHLLAHELTHTLQQGAASPTVQKSPDDGANTESEIHDFGIVYAENGGSITLFAQPEYQSSDENSELPVGSKVMVSGKFNEFYAVTLYNDSAVSGYVAAQNLVQAQIDPEGHFEVENNVVVMDKETFKESYPDLAAGISSLYWDYHDVGGFVESLHFSNEGIDFVNQLGYWSSLRFEQIRRRVIEGNNDYSAKNIYIWLDAVDSLVRNMVPLLAAERNREGAQADEAVQQLGFIREVLGPTIEGLLSHPYLDAGRTYMERLSIQKVVESLAYQQQSPAEKALPVVIEFLRLNPVLVEAQSEYSVYGAQLAQLLVLNGRNNQLNTYGFGLSAEGVREVFALLQNESSQLAQQALYQGETIGWLVANANMSGFGDFRAAGEGLLSGLSRGYYEEMNSSQPAPFDQWGVTDSATFYLWYSLGVPSGLALGAKDLVVGLFSLFTPSFWREMYTIFTSEEHRFKIGVGLGTAMAQEIRTYQGGDPATIGWKLGVLMGRIGFEVVFSLLTAGAFQVTKMAWASKFPKLAAAAEFVASSRVGQIAAAGASFVMGKLDDIIRVIRGLTDRLPALTAAQRMNRQIILLERESAILLEAAQASKALALADHVEEAASSIARLEEQLAALESRFDDVIDMVEVDGHWVAASDNVPVSPTNNSPIRQIEGPVSNPKATSSASLPENSTVSNLLDEVPTSREKPTRFSEPEQLNEPAFAEVSPNDKITEELLTNVDDPQLPVLYNPSQTARTGAQQALDLGYPPLPGPEYHWVAGRDGIPYVSRGRNSTAPKVYFDEHTRTFPQGTRSSASTAHLADISELNFTYSDVILPNGSRVKRVEGVLGQPGKVRQHRSVSAQRGVSAGTGEDAGHLVGNRFGATGDQRNLSLQNREANQFGSFKGLEDHWADLLDKGHGINVNVADITRAGENRPFMRSVSWTDKAPDGTVTNHHLDFANTTSPETRLRAGEAIPENDFPGEVIPITSHPGFN